MIMKLSIGAKTGILAASSILLVLLCITGARAQDADESGVGAAEESTQKIPGSRSTPHTFPLPQAVGSWTGTDTYVDGGGQGSGSMTLDLTQDGLKIRGTFSLTTSADETAAGSVTGKIITHTSTTIQPFTLTLTFHRTDGHDCTAAVVATVGGFYLDTMSGTFLFKGNKADCTAKGTFDLQKQ